MKSNMVTSLFRYERVQTTKAKALEVRRVAEKMVTRARVDSVHNRRIIAQRIHDPEILAKLFTEIAPRYLERPGGYTRVLKIGRRQGDAAEMVILELVDRKIEEKVRPEKESAQEKQSPAEPDVSTVEASEADSGTAPENDSEAAKAEEPKSKAKSTKATATKTKTSTATTRKGSAKTSSTAKSKSAARPKTGESKAATAKETAAGAKPKAKTEAKKATSTSKVGSDDKASKKPAEKEENATDSSEKAGASPERE